MLISSLMADDPARGNVGGGGVWAGGSRCQKPRPLPFMALGGPNAANNPFVDAPSKLMTLSVSSSGTPSSAPSSSGTVGNSDGDDCAVREGSREGSASLSLTCRMISASRRNSLSTGAASSHSSALMRPNCRDFGCYCQRLVDKTCWKHSPADCPFA
jgi:hypothetical protein